MCILFDNANTFQLHRDGVKASMNRPCVIMWVITSTAVYIYRSPSLNFFKQACCNNKLRLGSVSVSEVRISFLLFIALLAALLPQQTLHASVCFTNCNRSDPSALAAGKSLVGL